MNSGSIPSLQLLSNSSLSIFVRLLLHCRVFFDPFWRHWRFRFLVVVLFLVLYALAVVFFDLHHLIRNVCLFWGLLIRFLHHLFRNVVEFCLFHENFLSSLIWLHSVSLFLCCVINPFIVSFFTVLLVDFSFLDPFWIHWWFRSLVLVWFFAIYSPALFNLLFFFVLLISVTWSVMCLSFFEVWFNLLVASKGRRICRFEFPSYLVAL